MQKCYNWKVGSVGDFELRESYDRLCDNGILNDEYQIVEKKGLTCALDFPIVFKTK